MRGYYQDMINGFEEDDKFYEGLLDDLIEVPEGFDVTIPTTGRAIIDEAVDNVEPYDLMVTYAPRSFGKKAQEDAEQIQRFLKNLWLFWRQTNSDIDVLRDFIKNLFKNGKAIFKIVPDWSLWPTLSEAEEKKLMDLGGKPKVAERARLIKQLRSECFPVVCRSLSPRHVIEDPTMNARKLWAIEIYDTDLNEVRNTYTHLEVVNLDTFEPANFTVYELWTATWVDWNGVVHEGKHWTFINDQQAEIEDNPYYDIPYVIKHSGFGSETYDGKPELKAVGFFSRQVKSMLRAEMRRITHFDSLMSQLAFPILLIPEELEDIGFDHEPGAINYVPQSVLDNAKNLYLNASLPAPEYMQSINMIQGQIERGTTQRAIRGAGVPGTDSAAQLSMITAQAKLRLEPIKRACEEAVDKVNSMVLRYIDTIMQDSVSIFAAEPGAGQERYTLKPDMLKGRYRTKTAFMPSDDQVKERKLALVSDAMAKAQLNPYDAFVFAGWENPMEVIQRNLAYKVMNDPAVVRQLAKQALKDWGLDFQEIELEEMNDNNVLQQMMQEMKNRNAGQGAGAPGTPLAGNSPSGPAGPSGPGAPAPSPQAIGAPVQMTPQAPGVNQVAQMMGSPSG